MSDDADKAEAQIEQELARSIAYRKPIVKPIGVCLNCESEVGGGMLFCSHDCHEDWERREDARRRNG